MDIHGKFKGYFLSMMLIVVLLATLVIAVGPFDYSLMNVVSGSNLTGNPEFFNISINSTQNPRGALMYNFSNLSGTVFFNLTLQGMSNLTNVTFTFMDVQNHSIYSAGNITVLNATVFVNASGSRTYWNFTLNTKTLP